MSVIQLILPLLVLTSSVALEDTNSALPPDIHSDPVNGDVMEYKYDDTVDPLGMHIINPDSNSNNLPLTQLYFPNEENSSTNRADEDMQWSHSDTPVGSVASAKIGIFKPLDCNRDPWSNCESNLVSSIIPSSTNPLTIPCGECYTFDVQGNVTLGGLDIQGKLVFPLNHKVNVYTPYVIVQGELEINNHATISPDNVGTSFILTGTQDVLFNPTESPNQNACSGTALGTCNLGKKAFVIVGGKMNIRGMPDQDTSPSSSCVTYTPVLKKVHKDPIVDPQDFPKFTLLPDTCPSSSGRTFIKYDFETSYGNWTGRDGAFINLGNGSVRMSRRLLSDRGPYLDLTPMFPSDCLVPEQVYLMSAK